MRHFQIFRGEKLSRMTDLKIFRGKNILRGKKKRRQIILNPIFSYYPVLHNPAICNLTPEFKSIGYSKDDDDDGDESDEEDVWGPPDDDGNILDLVNDFDDEVDC